MSTMGSALGDSAVMLRRNFRHTLRNPVAVFNAVLFPVVIMTMFVYVYGDAFSVGVSYVDYATPGMLLLAICYGLSATATAVNSDVTKGVINRFKVMDVSRGAVLTGHVVSSVVTNLIAVTAVVAVAFALGFRPDAGPADWLGVVGLVLLIGFAVGWFTVAIGMAAKTPEGAGMGSVPLIMLPFFSSAVVPADKMGPGVREFAEYQPFTPIIELLRGLLAGTPQTGDAIAAVAWCAGIGIVGYVWATASFRRRA